MLLQKGVGHRGYWLATFAISAGGRAVVGRDTFKGDNARHSRFILSLDNHKMTLAKLQKVCKSV